jgi:hypothetical protein
MLDPRESLIREPQARTGIENGMKLKVFRLPLCVLCVPWVRLLSHSLFALHCHPAVRSSCKTPQSPRGAGELARSFLLDTTGVPRYGAGLQCMRINTPVSLEFHNPVLPGSLCLVGPEANKVEARINKYQTNRIQHSATHYSFNKSIVVYIVCSSHYILNSCSTNQEHNRP